jgi:hypothetical protein
MAKEWASGRVAVLMTPAENRPTLEKPSSMGLSLGQFFREAGAADVQHSSQQVAEAEALQAALTQLELSTVAPNAVLWLRCVLRCRRGYEHDRSDPLSAHHRDSYE